MDSNEKKIAFNEALEYLVESANINNGTLTIDEIKSAFEGIIDNDNMYSLVYDYMLKKNINVEGYTPSSQVTHLLTSADNLNSSPAESGTNLTEINFDENAASKYSENISVVSASASKSSGSKENSIIEMYLSEINNTKDFSELEEYELLTRYLSDHMNRETVNLLTEMNLKLVPPIADDFTDKGVLYSDLLQEGNLGLIEGIMTFRGKNNLDDFHEHIKEAIRCAMNDAILEQNASSRIGDHAADRANELDRASVHLSKELDRTPTLEELAKYLSLPQDEVEQIMKMSLNALTIHEDVEE